MPSADLAMLRQRSNLAADQRLHVGSPPATTRSARSDLNLRRRHLDESQRAMAAARVATLRDGQRADRVAASIEAATQDAAATRLNVSRSAVQRARVVIDTAAPEVVKLVEDGKMTASAAVAVAKATPARQKRVL